MYKLLYALLLGSSVTACGPLNRLISPDSQDKKAKNMAGARPEAKPLRLANFSSCEEADAYLRDNFRRRIRESLDYQQYVIENYDNIYGGMVEDRIEAAAGAPSEANKSVQNNTSAAPQDYSRTNTQVPGVDEPDIVKTNGTHMFSLSGSSVHIIKSWPAASMNKIGEIKIAGSPVGLMLTEKQKLVLVFHPTYVNPINAGEEGAVDARTSVPYPWYAYSYTDTQITRLAVYDVSQPAAPKLEKDLAFFGSYVSLRRQGDLLRLIQSDSFYSLPAGLSERVELSYGYRQKPDLIQYIQRRIELERKNEEALAKLTLNSYLAGLRSQRPSTKFDDPILNDVADCKTIMAEEAMSNLGLSKVTSINLGTMALSQLSVLAPATEVYSSETSLYLANSYRNWWWGWDMGQGVKTYLHKLKYDEQGSTTMSYEGSGMVDGYILNQFSMDEYKDKLRIAVTDETFVSSQESGRPVFTSSNRIYVLQSKDGQLESIGQSAELAPGERIYSTRFVGDKGYVVTFRQVDPLFTLDLSDPTAPKVLGELKIPGFSNYMHPISDTMLLAIGQDADPNSGFTSGLKISLFDVSNPLQPKEAHTFKVGGGNWSWSSAQYDHKAFTYFASRGLLAIPVGGYRQNTGSNSYWWQSFFSELMVFSIDPVKGITQKGLIPMNDLYQKSQPEWYDWWYGSQVERSVFADDYIYAISGQGVRVVNQLDFTRPVATVSFYP